MYEEAFTIADKDDRKRLIAWAMASESKNRIDAMISSTPRGIQIPILPGDMDTDPWMFNCTNGTIDLRTGELRPHKQADAITKLCPIKYLVDSTCPL